MAYEGAGIRFTEDQNGPQSYRQTASTQEPIQLLRLRLPRFSGAPPPAVPPQLLAGGLGAPAAAMPPALAQQLQAVMAALAAAMPKMQPGQAPGRGGPEPSPSAALQAILRGQSFGQSPAQWTYPEPRFQVDPPLPPGLGRTGPAMGSLEPVAPGPFQWQSSE